MSRVEFALPDVGEGLGEAEIVEWFVAVGDTVREDQPIVAVNTDKSVVDIPSPVDGTIASLGGEVGDVLPIGSLLAVIEPSNGAGASAPEAASDGGAANSMEFHPVGSPPATATPAAAATGGKVRAAPATRKLAVELGVDLAGVAGTGPNGRVTADDVRAAAEGPADDDEPQTTAPTPDRPATAPAPPSRATAEDRIEPLRGTRRQIARTMAAAWSVPHITDFREVDATELVRAHARLRDSLDSTRLTFLPLFVKATAAALRRHRRFNARIDLDAEQITYVGSINIGIAAATEQGLVVPVISDADRRSLGDIAAEIDRLAQAARAGRLAPGDAAHGTFTISNFGSYGTWLGTPIIRPPEVGIVGFGKIEDRVVAVDGAPVVRPVLPLAIATDHRLNDGADLGAFARTLTELLTDPVLLLLEP